MTMNRAETQNKPSVEELLVSIRQAIHGDSAGHLMPAAKQTANGGAVTGTMNQNRVSLQPTSGHSGGHSGGLTQKSTDNFSKLRNQLHDLGANSPHAEVVAPKPVAVRSRGAANGFAGILSGDVRLEEALEKLKRAGLGDAPVEAPVQPADEIRAGQFDTDETDYFTEEPEPESYTEEYAYETEPEQPEAPVDQFSHETRQAYIEPAPVVYETPMAPVAPMAPVEQEQQLAPITTPESTIPLTSETSAAETSAAFNRLADTIVGHASTGERSIDEITRELLRPMLQSWLDDNLPRLVERLVREEIERVARRGGK